MRSAGLPTAPTAPRSRCLEKRIRSGVLLTEWGMPYSVPTTSGSKFESDVARSGSHLAPRRCSARCKGRKHSWLGEPPVSN